MTREEKWRYIGKTIHSLNEISGHLTAVHSRLKEELGEKKNIEDGFKMITGEIDSIRRKLRGYIEDPRI